MSANETNTVYFQEDDLSDQHHASTDIEFNDFSVLREINLSQKEIEKFLSFPQSMTHIPGMEGFFSRLLGSIRNVFQGFLNGWTQQLYSWEALLTQDWKKMAERYLQLLNNNLPDSEQFTGTVCLRGERMEMEKNKSCMVAVVNLVNRLESNILSPEKTVLTKEMTNVIHYLEINKCKIDISRPSACKAGTRFTYGSVGRLGTAGYGAEPSLFLSTMNRVLNDWYRIYTELNNITKIENAVKKMEVEIDKRSAAMEKASDIKKIELGTQINNMKARMIAFRAIMRATIDLWNTTLTTHILLPVTNLGRNAGMKNDLTSWVLATKDE